LFSPTGRLNNNPLEKTTGLHLNGMKNLIKFEETTMNLSVVAMTRVKPLQISEFCAFFNVTKLKGSLHSKQRI
jgi:hypothetical protein